MDTPFSGNRVTRQMWPHGPRTPIMGAGREAGVHGRGPRGRSPGEAARPRGGIGLPCPGAVG